MNNEILRFVHIYLEPVLKIAKSFFKKVSYILESIMPVNLVVECLTLTQVANVQIIHRQPK